MMPYFDPGYFSQTDQDRRSIANKRILKDRLVAWELSSDYYDGDRSVGYGGYKYQKERWHKIVHNVFEYFDLSNSAKILDVGCKKAFFLQAVRELYPLTELVGIENHRYPIRQASASIKDCLQLKNYYELNDFSDGELDFLWAFSSIYMQNLGDVVKTLREIQRVSSGNAFVTVGAYRNESQKEVFESWTLLGTTVLSCEEWMEVFDYCGYEGFWFFTTPDVLGFK